MFKELQIVKEAVDVSYDDSLKSFPNECCGFLYGKESGEDRLITKAVPVVNSKEGDQKRRFEISPFEYMKAEQYALANDLTLLGVYHSHPNHPAIASVHDHAKAMPYFSYVIVSVMDGQIDDIKSWRLTDDGKKMFEEPVLIVSPSTNKEN